MKLITGKPILQNYAESLEREWIETNGLGGYASATVTGVNTRRYHGLLVASMKPPVERISLLSKLDEIIICDGESFYLGTNQYSGAVDPMGYTHLECFTKEVFPEWRYVLPNGIKLKKTIAALHDENTTVVIYEVEKSKNKITIELLPLVSGRDFHTLTHANDKINRDTVFENSVLKLKPYSGLPELYISLPGSKFINDPHWYYSFEYPVEKFRGLDFIEDLFTYGKLSLDLKEGDTFCVIISTEDPASKNGFNLFESEKKRRHKLTETSKEDIEKMLVLAADQFIVKRGVDLKSVIAGYHWFSDWGRDTMVALPGLCLSTKRFEDAKKILQAFSKSIDEGMLPNRFPDYGEAPEYNTVDATLWFFIAIKKYLDATGDKTFILNELLPALKNIIAWHYKGTRFNIHVSSDGLLFQGEPGQQLTWMDARIGSWVVTPRMGKTVEINALWFNMLMFYSDLLKMNGEDDNANTYAIQAQKIKEIFTPFFWNQDLGCLYDNIDGVEKDASIRPNQLFALSLPYPLVTAEKAKSILQVVKEKLYTPVGLRSLSQDHPEYKGHYGGDQLNRDGAYHQGTVWSWLLGPYIEALIKVNGVKGIAEAKIVIKAFSYHFNEACIGTISEIFEGDAPHKPCGCVAQAWSVGEILRVVKEYNLLDRKKEAKKEISSIEDY